MADTEKQKMLRRLTVLAERRRNLRKEIDGVVFMLKSPGLDGHCLATWTEVGQALGVTRQVAQRTYREFSWAGSPDDDGDTVA